MKISLVMNMKMPTIVGIFIFISRENFMLGRDEHEKSFITFGPSFTRSNLYSITKTRLFKYIEISPPKIEKIHIKNSDIFSYFCSKLRLWVLVRTASARRF